jgi:hypothetical protein
VTIFNQPTPVNVRFELLLRDLDLVFRNMGYLTMVRSMVKRFRILNHGTKLGLAGSPKQQSPFGSREAKDK